MRRTVIALAFGLVAACWLAPAASATTGCYPACVPPTATVSASVVNPMQSETVHGTNWCPGATITVTWDGTTVDTAVANQNGIFNASFKVPKNATPGPHTVTVTGSAFQCTAPGSVSITVTVAAGSTSATGLVLRGPTDPLQAVPAASHGYTFRIADVGIALCFVGFVLMLTHKKIWVSHPRRTPMLVRLTHYRRRPPASSRGRSR